MLSPSMTSATRRKNVGQYIRLLRVGQRVRVMQTTDMEAAGLANRFGTVVEKQRRPEDEVLVVMDYKAWHGRQTLKLPTSSLTR